MTKDSFSEKQPIDIGRPKKSLLVCLLDIKTEKPPQTHVLFALSALPYRTQIFLLVSTGCSLLVMHLGLWHC